MQKILTQKIRLLEKESGIMHLKKSIILLTTSQRFSEDFKILPFRYFCGYVGLPIAIQDNKIGMEITKKYSKKMDCVIVDIENKLPNCKNLIKNIMLVNKSPKLYTFKNNDLTADAAFSLLMVFFKILYKKRILIVGSGNIGSKLALKLIESGVDVFIINSSKKSSHKISESLNIIKSKNAKNDVIPITVDKIPSKLDCIIGFTRGTPVITLDMINKMRGKSGLILDGGTGTISREVIEESNLLNLNIMKLDTRMAFASHIELLIKSEELLKKIAGKKNFQKISIVAGGVIGKLGNIVVDNISNPTKIIGVADGNGRLLQNTKDYEENISEIKKLLNNR